MDSVGAGDSFIGGWLCGLVVEAEVLRSKGRRMAEGEDGLEALCRRVGRFACDVAGEKCRVRGLDLPPQVVTRLVEQLVHSATTAAEAAEKEAG